MGTLALHTGAFGIKSLLTVLAPNIAAQNQRAPRTTPRALHVYSKISWRAFRLKKEFRACVRPNCQGQILAFALLLPRGTTVPSPTQLKKRRKKKHQFKRALENAPGKETHDQTTEEPTRLQSVRNHDGKKRAEASAGALRERAQLGRPTRGGARESNKAADLNLTAQNMNT